MKQAELLSFLAVIHGAFCASFGKLPNDFNCCSKLFLRKKGEAQRVELLSTRVYRKSAEEMRLGEKS